MVWVKEVRDVIDTRMLWLVHTLALLYLILIISHISLRCSYLGVLCGHGTDPGVCIIPYQRAHAHRPGGLTVYRSYIAMSSSSSSSSSSLRSVHCEFWPKGDRPMAFVWSFAGPRGLSCILLVCRGLWGGFPTTTPVSVCVCVYLFFSVWNPCHLWLCVCSVCGREEERERVNILYSYSLSVCHRSQVI
jgi:hypothetical protein